jgi:hypothetical protein
MLLLFDGFDNAATMPKQEWDTLNTFQTQTGRDGLTASAASCSGGSSVAKYLALPSNYATLILGVAFQLGTPMLGTTTQYAFAILNSSNATLTAFTFDINGHLQVRIGGPGGTIIATSTYAFSANAWHHLQIKVTPRPDASGYVEIKGNGLPIITFNGINAPAGSAGTANKFSIGSAFSGIYTIVDDLWICDTVDATATQGRPNNDFLGDLKVATIIPTGPGSSTQWTPNSAVANWTTVDETPTNQTDYVTSSAAGQRDLYAALDLPTTATAVYGLRVGVYGQKTDAGSAFVKPAIKEPTSGTVNLSSALGLTTTFGGFWGDILTQKAAGGLWTVADVNGAEIGAEAA